MQFTGKVTIENGTIGSKTPITTSPGKYIFEKPVILIDSTIGDTSNMIFQQGCVEIKSVKNKRKDHSS